MSDLDDLLKQAIHEQTQRRPPQRRRSRVSPADDYARRLAERALYRKLINQTDVAQDGLRFIFYFSSPRYSQGQSLDYWRRRIDQEIERAKARRDVAKDSEN